MYRTFEREKRLFIQRVDYFYHVRYLSDSRERRDTKRERNIQRRSERDKG